MTNDKSRDLSVIDDLLFSIFHLSFGHFEGEALGGKACLQGERADEFSVRVSPYTARAFNAYRSSLKSPYPWEVQSLSPPGSQEKPEIIQLRLLLDREDVEDSVADAGLGNQNQPAAVAAGVGNHARA